MNHLDLAIHDTVHKYKGGTEELSEQMGMSATILRNKACPTNEHHQFHPHQLLRLQAITGNYAITDAFVAAKEKKQAKPVSIFSAVLKAAEGHGDVCKCIENALADNRLTERERTDCITAANEAIEALESLKHAILSHENQLKAV